MPQQNSEAIFRTKATYLGNGLYGCRLYFVEDGRPWCELRVPKSHIGWAFRDMLRTANKVGWQCPLAIATRKRMNRSPYYPLEKVRSKYIWFDRNDTTPL